MGRTFRATDNDVEELSDLLAMMVENVVTDFDSVKVTVSRTWSMVTLEFECGLDDVQFVIGVQRQTINAIERIMLAAAKQRGVGITMNFLTEKNRPRRDP